MQQNLIPDYGWVPFPYFQHILIIVMLISYYNYKKVNEKLNKNVYDKIKNATKNERINYYSQILIPLIPIFIILYLDLNFSSFSMSNLGVTKYISNDKLNSLLKLIGGYCIVQVAAQDVGLKTGKIQSDFFKLPILQLLMYTGVAYSLTQNRSMALIAALLYFQMKFFVSNNITKDVCFE
jgi:hypothetical protein